MRETCQRSPQKMLLDYLQQVNSAVMQVSLFGSGGRDSNPPPYTSSHVKRNERMPLRRKSRSRASQQNLCRLCWIFNFSSASTFDLNASSFG